MYRYDGFILDVWGVIHNGYAPYPGVVETLERLRTLGKRVVLLSNAPARSATVAARLESLGIAHRLYDEIVTSGEEVWQNLNARTDPFYAALGSRCLLLGPERHVGISQDVGLEFVHGVASASFILNSGPDDLDESGSLYTDIVAAAVARDLPMVCANADLVVMQGTEIIFCAGQLAKIYEAAGGRVRSHGKPLPSVYRTSLSLLGLSDKRRILAIGDNLHTDIAGAASFGLDSALTACGIHAAALGFEKDAPRLELAALERLIDKHTAPNWLIPSLRL